MGFLWLCVDKYVVFDGENLLDFYHDKSTINPVEIPWQMVDFMGVSMDGGHLNGFQKQKMMIWWV